MSRFIHRFTVTVIALSIPALAYFGFYRVFTTRILPAQLEDIDPFAPPLWLKAAEIAFLPAEALDAWMFRRELERQYRRHYSGAWESVDGALALTTEYDDGRLAVTQSDAPPRTFEIFNLGIDCFIHAWHHGDSVLEFSPTNPDIALLHVPEEGRSEPRTIHLVRLDREATSPVPPDGWRMGS